MIIKDALGTPLSPGDIVVLGSERRPRGNVYIGVVFDFTETQTHYNGVTHKVRVKIPADKGKTTPWGNSNILSLTLSHDDACHSLIAIEMVNEATKKQFGAARLLSDYMIEKGRTARVEKISDEKVIEVDGSLADILSELGAPKIEM